MTNIIDTPQNQINAQLALDLGFYGVNSTASAYRIYLPRHEDHVLEILSVETAGEICSVKIIVHVYAEMSLMRSRIIADKSNPIDQEANPQLHFSSDCETPGFSFLLFPPREIAMIAGL